MEQQTDQSTAAPSASAPTPVATGTPSAEYTVAGLAVSSAGKRIGAALLEGVLATVTFGIGYLIWCLMLWSKGTGQTPGKKLMKMRCVSVEDERPAGFGAMIIRQWVGYGILGFLSIISFFMLFGATRQTIADKLAKTVVVDDPDESLA